VGRIVPGDFAAGKPADPEPERGTAGPIHPIRLEACGPVAGLLKEVEYEEACLQLTPDDLFIGYTDGISEAMTVADEERGEDGLRAAAGAVWDGPVRKIPDVIFRAAA
jgi:serine phosphatase RsbU (regulator of sigma subunit)